MFKRYFNVIVIVVVNNNNPIYNTPVT